MDKWKRILYIIFQFLFIVSIIVCSKKSEQKKDKTQLAAFKDSTVVAIINDEAIYYQDVDDVAKQLRGLSNKINYKDSVIQQEALDWLIANMLLRQEAKNHVIELKKQEVDKAIAQIKKNFPSEDKFNEALQQGNLSRRKFEENVILDLKVQKLLEQQVITKIEVTTDEAKKYYQENVAKYQKPEQAWARHILIKVKKDAIEDEVEKAQQKAQSILAKLKRGEDFIELAKTHSEGPSASKGGDLGYFSRGDMVKAFDDKVFSMKPGEISDIVRTEFGFHIIKLEGFKKSRQIPFEEKEDEIKAYLKQVNSQELFEKYIKELKQKSDIQIREKE